MSGKKLRIHVLNQGHGDCLILECPDGSGANRFALVDCHRSQPALEYLKRLGCTQLDHLFATHAHSDHILGLPAVLRDSGIKPKILWITHTDHPSTRHR